MSNTVDKVIKIAQAEIGYTEKSALAYKSNPSILDSKYDGAGHDNYTKYGRDMHAIYPSVMDFPAAWCDCFVDWCFYKAYDVCTAKSLLCGNFDDYTVSSANMYKQKNAWYTDNPQIGDQIFFKDGSGQICHTGLIENVSGNVIYTIEGNSSDCVARRTYVFPNYRIAGFGRPKYDGAIQYVQKSVEEIAKEVLCNKWGVGIDRVNRLTSAGYNSMAVQNEVNKILANKKPVDEVAKEVLINKWGVGEERKTKLTEAGYNYDEVQAMVNTILLNKKSVEEIATEVLNNKWGVGDDRRAKLTAAGYNYNDVQNAVNQILTGNNNIKII